MADYERTDLGLWGLAWTWSDPVRLGGALVVGVMVVRGLVVCGLLVSKGWFVETVRLVLGG